MSQIYIEFLGFSISGFISSRYKTFVEPEKGNKKNNPTHPFFTFSLFLLRVIQISFTGLETMLIL
jgi:hypothetical protein